MAPPLGWLPCPPSGRSPRTARSALVPASVTGPVRGPRSASTSRRFRVAGRSVPVRSATVWVCGTLLSEVSEVRRGFAMLNRLSLAGDVASRLLSPLLRGAELVKKRVAKALPALCLLQRRQLLSLAEQTAGTALLGATSLVVGHGRKLSADVVPQARPRLGGANMALSGFHEARVVTRAAEAHGARSLGPNHEQKPRQCAARD